MEVTMGIREIASRSQCVARAGVGSYIRKARWSDVPSLGQDGQIVSLGELVSTKGSPELLRSSTVSIPSLSID